MRLILVSFILSVILFAQSLQLQESYNISSNDIYAKHIFKDIKSNFFLLSIPEHSNRFKISSKKIEAEFLLHGINIKTNRTGIVTFIRSDTFDTSILKNELASKFQEALPTLNIDNISLMCRCKLKELPKDYKIVIKRSSLHKSSGTFYIKHNNERHFFTYKIKATLAVIKTKDDVKNKEQLNAYNTYDDEIDFKNFNSIPLQNISLGQVISSRSLKKNTIITQKHVKKLPLIRKGDYVRVQLNDGAVRIEFGAKALKDGSLSDIISIRKSDGSRLEATVIGKGMVSL